MIATSSVTTYATAAPYDSVIVSGTFIDANRPPPLTASIDWGDGSSPTVLDLPAGSYAFSAPHDYTTDAGLPLQHRRDLERRLRRDRLRPDDASPSATRPREFAAPGLVLSSSSIDENGTVTVSGTIVSPGGIHTNTVSIDWGDGSTDDHDRPRSGRTTRSPTTHTYLNNPAGVASGNYAINGSVTNEEGKVGTASAQRHRHQRRPAVHRGRPEPCPKPTANEGDTVTLDGQFTDPGTLDPHTVTIDWGDGSTPTVLYELLGQVVASATPGLYHLLGHPPVSE